MSEELTTDLAIKPKKRVNSKGKGNSFENKISKLLSETFNPLQFRRSQSSGAILGGTNRRFANRYSRNAAALFVGDVTPTNEEDVIKDYGWYFRFSLECKSYKTVETLEQLLANTKLNGWFTQAMEDASKVNRLPMLIFKYNHTSMFCGVSDDVALPSTISFHLHLKNPTISISLFHLEEALKDVDWWKTFTIPKE